MTDSSSKPNRASSKQPTWMLYVAGIFGGVLLLADALGFAPLQRVPAKLAIALIYSTFVLMTGKGKAAAITAALLMWTVVVVTFIW